MDADEDFGAKASVEPHELKVEFKNGAAIVLF